MPVLAEGWYVGDDYMPLENYGRVIEDRIGWDDTPGRRGDDATLLGVHGNQWRPKRYGPGRKTLTLAIHGVNPDGSLPAERSGRRAKYERHLDEFLRQVVAPGALQMWHRIHADGAHRAAMAEVINPITPESVADDFGRVQFELSIPGGFFGDMDPETHTLTYDPAGDDEQRVEAYSLRGQTAPCSDAVVTVTGGCSSVSVFDYLTGAGFSYGAVSEGELLVVDAGAFTAEKNGVDVITSMSMAGGGLLEVSPAPSAARGPDLRVTATGASGGFSVTLVTRRKWLR